MRSQSRTVSHTQLAPASSYWSAQKLIRKASLGILVKDVPAAVHAADSIAQAYQGLLADSRTSQDADGKRTAEIVIRVPSQMFSDLLNGLRGVGTIKSDSVGTQDVTKDYADLETRLAVKEQAVARMRVLLDTRTAKLTDVVELERELSQEVSELEQMKGERQYYDQQVAVSTIHLSLFERTPSHVSQLAQPMSDALTGSLQLLSSSVGALIYIVVALLPWIIVALGVVWAVPPWRRKLLTHVS